MFEHGEKGSENDRAILPTYTPLKSHSVQTSILSRETTLEVALILCILVIKGQTPDRDWLLMTEMFYCEVCSTPLSCILTVH